MPSSVTFTDFINHELIEFSRADLIRSIPSAIDGLKPSQRKVIFGALRKGGGEVKVAQLAGYVAENTAYHHGEASLLATIVKLAQVGDVTLLHVEWLTALYTHALLSGSRCLFGLYVGRCNHVVVLVMGFWMG